MLDFGLSFILNIVWVCKNIGSLRKGNPKIKVIKFAIQNNL